MTKQSIVIKNTLSPKGERTSDHRISTLSGGRQAISRAIKATPEGEKMEVFTGSGGAVVMANIENNVGKKAHSERVSVMIDPNALVEHSKKTMQELDDIFENHYDKDTVDDEILLWDGEYELTGAIEVPEIDSVIEDLPVVADDQAQVAKNAMRDLV